MVAFVLRRLGVLGVILFGSSFILYNVAAISGDPTADLRLSTDPNSDYLIASFIEGISAHINGPLKDLTMELRKSHSK